MDTFFLDYAQELSGIFKFIISSQFVSIAIIYSLRTAIKNLSEVISKNVKPGVQFKWCVNPENDKNIMLAMIVDLPDRMSLSKSGDSLLPDQVILDELKCKSGFAIVNTDTMFHCYSGNVIEKELKESSSFAQTQAEMKYRKSFLFILKPNTEKTLNKMQKLKKFYTFETVPGEQSYSKDNTITKKNRHSTLKYFKTLDDVDVKLRLNFNLVYRGTVLKYKRSVTLYKEGACLARKIKLHWR